MGYALYLNLKPDAETPSVNITRAVEGMNMVCLRYHKTNIGMRELKPGTLMLGYGDDPTLSEGRSSRRWRQSSSAVREYAK